MSCADVQTIQSGNGTKTQFSFDFPYIFKSEIHVYFWNATTKEWDEKLTTDATYPWQIDDANPTIVEFTGTAPPAPATTTDPYEPEDVDNVKIRRITNTDDIRALFNPGSAIRSDDLNKNFEQLRYALQEANCPGVTEEVEQYLRDYYWDNFDHTVYGGDTWDSDDDKIATTAAIDNRFHDNQGDTIRSDESWVNSDDKIATTQAISDYVDDVITSDITGADGIDVRPNTSNGTTVIGIAEGGIDFNELHQDVVVIESESRGDLTGSGLSDSELLSAAASEHRYRNYVQNEDPGVVNKIAGQSWFDTSGDSAFSVFDGTTWRTVSSGGDFTTQPTTIYVDANNGRDDQNGRRIINQVQTIQRALDLANDGDMITVAPGVYQENLPLNIRQKNLSIIGDSIRSVFIQPVKADEYQMTDNLQYTDEVKNPDFDATQPESETNKRWISATLLADPNAATTDVENPNYNQVVESVMFRVNSGTYISDMTFVGMQANNSGTHAIDAYHQDDNPTGLPGKQGWIFGFMPGCIISKSPYIQNCTNFSDSGIDNNNAFNPADSGFNPGESPAYSADPGYAGDITSSFTGGGIIVDGSVPAVESPLRSIVADSFTQVGLKGPGIFVTNNGYSQLTSSYSFFGHYHLKAHNGGQANLAASTTDFGDHGLVADGKSSDYIFEYDSFSPYTDPNDPNGSWGNQGDPNIMVWENLNLDIDDSWHGSSTRPQPNMLVQVMDGNTNPIYPVVSAERYLTNYWKVVISNPDQANKSVNLGLISNIPIGTKLRFYLRSMIASSGHTMEYVGSGTNYSALPENGGTPNETKQITELNRGKVWAVTVDHKGKLKAGSDFAVDQETGAVLLGTGALAIPTLITDLDTNGQTISDGQGDIQIGDNVDMNSNKIVQLGAPAVNTDAANKAYVDNQVAVNATAISSNASNISTNASNIATNTANIATNAGNISTNTADIATNAGNISTNVTAIAGKLALSGGVMTGNIDLDGNDLVDVGALNTTGNVIIGGNLTVNGTTTSINSTTLQVDDRNIELGTIATPTDSTADGGGITLKGASDKTFKWLNFSDSWTSSEHLNVVFGKEYQIAGNSVLSSTDLGSTVVNSSLETLGTISTGTWNGTTIGVNYGGTGQTSYTDGQLLIGNSNGNTLSKATLSGGNGVTVTNGNGSITLDADLKANGGLVFDNGEIKLDLTATGFDTFANGQLLIGNASTGSLDKATLGASNGISVVNGAGSVSVIGNNASLSQRGVVQLNNSTTSSSETLAATSKALKTGLDSKLNLTGGTLTGSVYVQSSSGIRFYDQNAAGWVGLAAPTSGFANTAITFSLPTSLPSANNQSLLCSTAGDFSFGQPPGTAQGGAGNPCFYENPTNVTTDYTITTGYNAMSAGPITVNAGVTVTVPTGSSWNIV